jgi:hypothetical protein
LAGFGSDTSALLENLPAEKILTHAVDLTLYLYLTALYPLSRVPTGAFADPYLTTQHPGTTPISG